MMDVLLWDYLINLFYPFFFFFFYDLMINSTRVLPLRKWVGQQGTGGSVVEFSPATQEARVRFPASAFLFNMDLLI